MNATIRKIFHNDQKERNLVRMGLLTLNELAKKDKTRESKVNKIFKKQKKLTGEDLFYIALIFHHRGTIIALKKAKSFAEASFSLGYKKSKKLLKLIEDRSLIKQGKRQRYNTQKPLVLKKKK